MPDYIVLDLAEIAREMGSHFDSIEAETVTGQCPVCAAKGRVVWVAQDQDRCDICSTPVIWKGSKLWQQLYGSPTERLRALTAIPAVTRSGRHLIESAGLQGWHTKTDAEAWAKAVRMFGDPEMIRIADYVLKNKRGEPAIRHAIAIAKKKIRSGKVEGRKETPQDDGPKADPGLDLKVVT